MKCGHKSRDGDMDAGRRRGGRALQSTSSPPVEMSFGCGLERFGGRKSGSKGRAGYLVGWCAGGQGHLGTLGIRRERKYTRREASFLPALQSFHLHLQPATCCTTVRRHHQRVPKYTSTRKDHQARAASVLCNHGVVRQPALLLQGAERRLRSVRTTGFGMVEKGPCVTSNLSQRTA